MGKKRVWYSPFYGLTSNRVTDMNRKKVSEILGVKKQVFH
jgi:hypothetical protein